MLQQEQQNSNNYFSVESLLRYSKIDEGLLNKPIAEKDAHKVKYSGFEIFCHLVNAPILGCNNVHQLSQSRDTKALGCGKDVLYRKLGDEDINWRDIELRLGKSVSDFITTQFPPEDNEKQTNVFIVDDTMIQRLRSHNAEMLTRLHNHVTGKSEKAYNNQTLGFSDGVSFVPLCFSVHSSANPKNLVNPDLKAKERDGRTAVGKRFKELTKRKPTVLMDMISQALNRGIDAEYVLMDSWYFSDGLIAQLASLGLGAISLIKRNIKFAPLEGDKCITQKQLMKTAVKEVIDGHTVYSRLAKTKIGRKVKLVFVKSYNNPSVFLTIVSTDTALSSEEILVLYARRWKIEVNFKIQKQYLGLTKGTQACSFTSIYASMALASIRYLLIELHRRMNMDSRSLGALFDEARNRLHDIPFIEAINTLLNLMNGLPEKLYKAGFIKQKDIEKVRDLIYDLLSGWFKGIDYYIKQQIIPIKSCQNKNQ